MSDVFNLEARGKTLLITLDRSPALNALNSQVMNGLAIELTPYDRLPDIGCFVVTGSKKTFAAGADTSEMSGKDYMDMILMGGMMDAEEALQPNLIARVFSDDDLHRSSLEAAETIASFWTASVMLARESVERAVEGLLPFLRNVNQNLPKARM